MGGDGSLFRALRYTFQASQKTRKKKAREKLAFSIQRIRLSGNLEQAMVIDTLKQMMHHSDYRRLHLSMDTKQETCSNRVPDMTHFAAKHLKFDSR